MRIGQEDVPASFPIAHNGRKSRQSSVPICDWPINRLLPIASQRDRKNACLIWDLEVERLCTMIGYDGKVVWKFNQPLIIARIKVISTADR